MALPPVLKLKHSLHGKRITPVALKLQATGSEEVDTSMLARLKKDHPLQEYSLSELSNEFHSLTGENVDDVLTLMGKDIDLDNVRLLVHYSIIYANEVGAPRRQPLVAQTGNTSANGAPSSESAGTCSKGEQGSDFAARLEVVEKRVTDLKGQHNDVEEALRQVRILAGNPSLTAPHVMLAAVEALVDAATRKGHKEADYYSESLQACRRFDNSFDLCGVVLKLLGSAEDKKISSAIAEWSKNKKYNDAKEGSVTQKNAANDCMPQSPLNGSQNFPPWFMPPSYPGFWPFQGFPSQGFHQSRGGFGRVRGPYQRRNVSGPCHYCGELGHVVANCQKIKNVKKD